MHVNDGSNRGNFQFNWMGLGTLLSVSSNFDNIDGILKLYGLNGSGNNIIFKLGEVMYDLKVKRHLEWLWLGHSQVSWATITSPPSGHSK